MKLQEISFKLIKIGSQTVSVVVFGLTGLVIQSAHADTYNVAPGQYSPTIVVNSPVQSSVAVVNNGGGYGTSNNWYNGSITLTPGANLLGDSVNGYRLAVYSADQSGNGTYNNAFGSGSSLNLLGNNSITGDIGLHVPNGYYPTPTINPIGTINTYGPVTFNGNVYANNINLNTGTTASFWGNVGANGAATSLNYGANNTTVTLYNGVNVWGPITKAANSTNGTLNFEGNANIYGNVGYTQGYNGSSIQNSSTLDAINLRGGSNSTVVINGSLAANQVNFQAQSVLGVSGDLLLNVNRSGGAVNQAALNNFGGTLQVGGNLVGVEGTNAVTTTLNNSGTLTMLGGTQSIYGNVGQSGYALSSVNVGGANSGLGLDFTGVSSGSSSTTMHGNIYAQTVSLNNSSVGIDSALTMASGYNINGNVVTDTNHHGSLVLAGGAQTVTGNVGASNLALASVSSGQNNATSTFTGNIFADSVSNLGTGTSNYNGNVTANAIGVNGGVSNFVGNVTGLTTTATTTIGTGGIGNFNTAGNTTTTSTLAFSGAGTANLYTGLTGNINYAGNNGTVNVWDAQSINGNVSTTTNHTGILNFKGDGAVSGTIGGSGLGVSQININSSAQQNTTAGVTLSGNTYADAVNLKSGGVLTLADGVSLTGTAASVTSLTGTGTVLNTDASNSGSLRLLGSSAITGVVGSSANPLNNIQVLGTGKSATFNNMVYASNLQVQGAGTTVTLNGQNGAAGGMQGTVDMGNQQSTLSIGNAVNLTTGASGINFANAGNAALNFVGNSTVTGDLGSLANTNSGNFKDVYAGANGKVVNFMNNVYLSSTTLHVSGTGVVNLYGNLNGPLNFDALGGSVNVADGKSISGAVTTSNNGYGTLNYMGSTTLQNQIGAASPGNYLNTVGFHAASTDGNLTVTPGSATIGIGQNIYANYVNIGASNNTTIANLTGNVFLGNNLTLGGTGTTLNTAGTVSSSALSPVDFAHTVNANGSLNNAATVTQSTFGTGAFTTNGGTLNFALGTTAWSAQNGGGLVNAAGSSKITGGSGSTLVMSGAETVNASFLGSLRNGSTFTLVDAAGGTDTHLATLHDNSYVMGSSLTRGSGTTAGDLILTVNRTANDYVTLSNTSGHFSNNAAIRLGTLASTGLNYTSDFQTALNKLDIDQWGYGNNAANLATQVKRLAPIANNSIAQTAFSAVSLGNASVANRVQELRNVSEGQVDAQGIWLKSDYARGSQGASGNYDGYSNRISGLSIGYDTRPDANSIVGMALGYNSAKVQQNDFRSGDTATIGSTILSAYAGYNLTQEAFVDASLSHGWQDFDSSRAAIVGRTANANYNGTQWLGRLTAGYRFQLDDAVTTLTPMLNYEQANMRQKAYAETNAGDIGLNMASQSNNRKQTSLGLRYSTQTYAGGMQIKPEVTLSAGRETSNLNQGVVASYIGDTTGTTFVTPTQDPSKRFAALGLGATMVLSKTSSLLLRLDSSQRAGLNTQALTMLARWEL